MLAAVLISSTAVAGGTDVARRIEHIQHDLLPPVLIAGETAHTTELASRMQDLHVLGVGIAVIHEGRLEWARGFGVMRIGGPPVTADTLFQAASISKPVFATAVMSLVQSGKLDLDTDVNRYLKSWKLPENEFTREAKVTLRELLTHSGGITVQGFGGYDAGTPVPTLVQVLDGASPANNEPIRAAAVPGKTQRYSGGGFIIAQQAVSDVTRCPSNRAALIPVLKHVFQRHPSAQRDDQDPIAAPNLQHQHRVTLGALTQLLKVGHPATIRADDHVVVP
jgi:CubicO group peptidase (beta-lactamase class C family)